MATCRARLDMPQYKGQWSMTDQSSRSPYFAENAFRRSRYSLSVFENFIASYIVSLELEVDKGVCRKYSKQDYRKHERRIEKGPCCHRAFLQPYPDGSFHLDTLNSKHNRNTSHYNKEYAAADSKRKKRIEYICVNILHGCYTPPGTQVP